MNALNPNLFAKEKGPQALFMLQINAHFTTAELRSAVQKAAF